MEAKFKEARSATIVAYGNYIKARRRMEAARKPGRFLRAVAAAASDEFLRLSAIQASIGDQLAQQQANQEKRKA